MSDSQELGGKHFYRIRGIAPGHPTYVHTVDLYADSFHEIPEKLISMDERFRDFDVLNLEKWEGDFPQRYKYMGLLRRFILLVLRDWR